MSDCFDHMQNAWDQHLDPDLVDFEMEETKWFNDPYIGAIPSDRKADKYKCITPSTPVITNNYLESLYSECDSSVNRVYLKFLGHKFYWWKR